MKNKIGKIILFNIIAIFIIFLIAELSVFSIKLNNLLKEGEFSSDSKLENIQKIIDYYFLTYKRYKEPPFKITDFRKPEKKASSKGQIILFGCSYTYGFGLKENETFSYILSDKTKRTVYNFGLNSSSPREILYFLRDKSLVSALVENTNNVEFVIYTYIQDHIKRLYYNLNELSPLFTVKDNHLVFKKNNLLTETFLYREGMLYKYDKKTTIEEKNELFKLYMKEINEEIKKDFSYKGKIPKFVILTYSADWETDFEGVKKLDDNIIVLNVEDLVKVKLDNPKYTISQENKHPNKNAWNEIVPKLIKKLKIV